jgi:hypothetical protein
MSRNYSVTEPHPSVPKSGTFVLGSGIGGAGNFKRYTPAEVTQGSNAQGPPSRITLARAPSSQRTIRVGRGGAGNFVPTSPETEQAMFQFDEEMHARREHQAPVYHIGRGGAANFVNESKPRAQRMPSSDASSVSSGSSAGSARRSIEAPLASSLANFRRAHRAGRSILTCHYLSRLSGLLFNNISGCIVALIHPSMSRRLHHDLGALETFLPPLNTATAHQGTTKKSI